MNPYLDVLVNDLDVGAELVGASEAAAADGAAVRLLLVGRVDGGDVVVEPRLAGEGLAAVVAGEPDLVHVHLQCNVYMYYRFSKFSTYRERDKMSAD